MCVEFDGADVERFNKFRSMLTGPTKSARESHRRSTTSTLAMVTL